MVTISAVLSLKNKGVTLRVNRGMGGYIQPWSNSKYSTSQSGWYISESASPDQNLLARARRGGHGVMSRSIYDFSLLKVGKIWIKRVKSG